jgi:hypothetical protein
MAESELVFRLSETLARGGNRAPGQRRTHSCTPPMLKLNRIGILGGPVRCHRIAFKRSFALSRFPDRGAPSGGRTRPPPPTPLIRPTQGLGRHPDPRLPLAQDESTLDTSSPPLWEESQRQPSSDPEDGLKRLLQNESLVVTRSVTLGRHPLRTTGTVFYLVQTARNAQYIRRL